MLIKPYQTISIDLQSLEHALSEIRNPFSTKMTQMVWDTSHQFSGGFIWDSRGICIWIIFHYIYIYVCMYVWVQILSMFRIYIYIIYYILYIILYIYIILHTHGLCMSISLWITYKLGFTSARPKNEVRDEDASKTLATTSVFAPNM